MMHTTVMITIPTPTKNNWFLNCSAQQINDLIFNPCKTSH